MNNLSSYCGLVDVKIRASDKDLPVTNVKKFVAFSEYLNFMYLELKLHNQVFFSVGGLWVLLASFHTQLEITFVTPD